MSMKKPYSDDVKFLHYRAYDEIHVGNDEYEYVVASNGGATVAYIEGEEGISHAFAYCHDADRYNKELGRIKSAGRLLSENYCATVKATRDEFIKKVDDHMAQQYLFRKSKV